MKTTTKNLMISAAILGALGTAHAAKKKAAETKAPAAQPVALGKCTQSNSCHAEAIKVDGTKQNNTCANHVEKDVNKADCDKMKGKWEANAK